MLTNSSSSLRVCLARNELSGKAASPALHIAFAWLGFACPDPILTERGRERFGGAPIAVCLELAQGPIASALLEYDFFVLFPVRC